MPAANRIALLSTVLALSLSACADGPGAPKNSELTATVLEEGLHHPWSLAFLPDQSLLITERRGNLLHLSDGQRRVIDGSPTVYARGQGGLLDILLHPDFANNHWLYLSYAKPCGDDKATTAIGKGQFQDGTLIDFQDIFVANACQQGGRHFGGRLLFDNQGYLYLTIGDRGERDQAQDTGDHIGTLVRLHEDGQIPDDNPLVGQADAEPAIWSWGHRNAQGLALHPATGEIWLHEHGPRGGDEINHIRPGINYGWPVITHGREYYGPRIGPAEKEGYESPLKHWTPSIAPSGMVFVDSRHFPHWQYDILVGALAGQHLARVSFDGLAETGEERLLSELGERIRDVRQGPGGHIYLLTDSDNGKLLKLKPDAKRLKPSSQPQE